VRAEAVLEDLAELFRVALAESGGSGTTTLAERDRPGAALPGHRAAALRRPAAGGAGQLDPAADGARVPPLVLQPLVENAVRHGVEPARLAAVRVAHPGPARPGRDRCTTPLPDDGRAEPGNGMALANVRERLRLLHDLDAPVRHRRLQRALARPHRGADLGAGMSAWRRCGC
jgi:two-component system sensor histidine kinase AlgZ